jgi:hypothetical protein
MTTNQALTADGALGAEREVIYVEVAMNTFSTRPSAAFSRRETVIGANTAGDMNTVARESQVPLAYGQALGVVEELEKASLRLIERIQPALRPTGPTPPVPADRTAGRPELRDVALRAPLADAIDMLRGRINSVTCNLQDAVSRLEL